MDDEPVIRISLRDVYDAVGRLEAKVEDRLNQHEEKDDERFSSLNLKVFGILATVSAASVAIVAQLSGVHL